MVLAPKLASTLPIWGPAAEPPNSRTLSPASACATAVTTGPRPGAAAPPSRARPAPTSLRRTARRERDVAAAARRRSPRSCPQSARRRWRWSGRSRAPRAGDRWRYRRPSTPDSPAFRAGALRSGIRACSGERRISPPAPRWRRPRPDRPWWGPRPSSRWRRARRALRHVRASTRRAARWCAGARGLEADEIDESGRVGQRGHDRRLGGDVDEIAAAGGVAMKQRNERADRGLGAGPPVGLRLAHPHGHAVRLARERHGAARGHELDVARLPCAARADAAEGPNGDDYQPRIILPQRVRIEVRGGIGRREQADVGRAQQILDPRPVAGRLQI